MTDYTSRSLWLYKRFSTDADAVVVVVAAVVVVGNTSWKTGQNFLKTKYIPIDSPFVVYRRYIAVAGDDGSYPVDKAVVVY